MKTNYKVICELRNENGMLLKKQIHECINMNEVFELTEICNRCGWTIKEIFEIA